MKKIIIALFFILLTFLIINYFFEIPMKNKSLNKLCNYTKYDQLKLKGKLSDKYLIKNYLSDNFPNINKSKVLFQTKDPNEIKSFCLPKNFVMKSTSGARMFHIVKNNKYEINEIIKKAKYFLSVSPSDYGYRKIPRLRWNEPHYEYNEPRIIFEEYLGDDLEEFRLMIIKGKIIYYELINKKDRFVLNEDWARVNINTGSYKILKDTIEKPKKLQEMIDFSNDFYQKNPIDIIRMDFYLKGDDFYFGECTFTPENCLKRYNEGFLEKHKKLF